MILSDGSLRRMLQSGAIKVEPLDDQQIQPASIDFRLDPRLLVFRSKYATTPVDPFALPEDLHEATETTLDNPFVLAPGQFVLGSTLERLTLPPTLVARVEGKSSLARLGLAVHATAGFVDAGWSNGQITLELSNVSPNPLLLYPRMKVGQFAFEMLDATAQRPYGHPDLNSKYTRQDGPVGSRYDGNTKPA